MSLPKYRHRSLRWRLHIGIIMLLAFGAGLYLRWRHENAKWQVYWVSVKGSPTSAKFHQRVPAGGATRSRQTIASESFFTCTAIIVDCGDEAVFIHALPSAQYTRQSRKRTIFCNTAMKHVLKGITLVGVDRKDVAVYLDAGTQEDFVYLVDALRKEEIPVAEASVHPAVPRNITFDPAEKRMQIEEILEEPTPDDG